MTETSNTVSQSVYDIAIIGGGMVGLSLAILLKKALPDLRTCVLDEKSYSASDQLYQPSFDARSTAISSQSTDILQEMGIWTALSEHLTEIETVHVSDRGHMGTTAFSREENQGQALGYVVENAWLGRQLVSGVEALDVDVLAPQVVNRIRFHPDGAELLLNDEQSLQCRLAVVADGADSSLRQQLGIDVDEHDYRQSALIANVSFDQAHHGVAYERFTARGPMALLPLGESNNASQSALVWTWPQEQIDEVLAWDDERFLNVLQDAFGYRVGKFMRVGKRYAYPLKRLIAKEQVRTSLVLMGNAAHFLHPVAGQGFNLALRDCACLTKVLSQAHKKGQNIGQLSVLQGYMKEQERDQWLTTGLSDSFNRVFSNERFAAQVVRNLGLIGLNIFAPVKKVFFNQMMGKGERSFSLRD